MVKIYRSKIYGFLSSGSEAPLSQSDLDTLQLESMAMKAGGRTITLRCLTSELAKEDVREKICRQEGALVAVDVIWSLENGDLAESISES